MTLPVDPAGSCDPGGLVIRPPPPPPGKPFGGGTDRLLRPIPLSPKGVRERSSIRSEPSPTRVFANRIRRTSVSSGSSTALRDVVHRRPPTLHRNRVHL